MALVRSLYINICSRNMHRLNIFLQSEPALINFSNLGTLDCSQQQQRIQSRFMLASCLDGHAAPSHETGDRAPSVRPSTGQRPRIPAMAPGSPALPCSGYTYEHNTEKGPREKKCRKQRKAGKYREVRQLIEGGGVEVRGLKGQGWINPAISRERQK